MGIEDIRSAMQAYCIIEDSDKNCIFPINTNSIKSAFKLMGKTMRTE